MTECFSVFEVVNKLIGDIRPVGATHIDYERFANQKEFQDIADQFINSIIDISYMTGIEFSIASAREEARRYLIGLSELLVDAVESWGDNNG